jgi:hypothetical protein
MWHKLLKLLKIKTLGADKMAYGKKKKAPGKTGTGKKKY